MSNCTNMNKTLIFLDWDDTLFPTAFVQSIEINLELPSTDTIAMFEMLDALLTDMLIQMVDIGDILIVTNGSSSWIKKCLNVLPSLKQIIDNGVISITSARDIFEDEFDHSEWKRLTFKLFFNEHISNNEGIHKILSFGDSDAEHKAVMELRDHNIDDQKQQKRIIGSVKFVKKPTLNQLIQQLTLIKLMHKDIIDINDDKIYYLNELLAF